jgi:carboxyl-terminal processing protease
MKMRKPVFAVLFIAAAALLAPWYGPVIRASAATPASASNGDDLDASVRSLTSAYALVEKNFADPVSSEKAIYQGAIPGMLHTLDPHSNFVDPTEYKEMQRRQKAAYFGVGMEITMDNGKVVVTRPFTGSPAYRADLRRGDIISAVDGKDTTGLDSAAVADMLRGPRGTPVRITVKREGAPDFISQEVTRGEIETSIVDAFWYKPGVVYLKIDSFEAQNVAKDVDSDLRKLGEQGVTGMVLDLRGNPGGLVNEAVAVAGRFLKDGQMVVSHRGRAEAEQVFRARSNALAQKYPIVVLVDNRSASAAEIVSGALQDHDRAWLIGDTTFGKGLVQAQFPLSEGALLLTIAHYYTPSGRLIQRDYSNRSFFDYYYARHDQQNLSDLKTTDSGRKVYGGGGITPDEKYPSPRYSAFQRRVAPVTFVYFHFGNQYFAGRKPTLPANWQPDEDLMERFKTFVKSQKIDFTEEEWNANKDWVKGELRYELYFRAFDKQTADRARWQDDPEVKKAVEDLPKSQSLLQQVQRVLAQRGARG